MKSIYRPKAKFLKSITSNAAKYETRLPWARGAARSMFIEKRQHALQPLLKRA